AKDDKEKAEIASRRDVAIDALGSGSDYTAFLDHLTVASMNLGFAGESSDGGVYHSKYDSFYWYTHFSDKDFIYNAALSRVMGTAILRLANADVLPFEFTATAHTLSGYVDEIQRLVGDTKGAPSLDLAPLRASIAKLQKSADAYNATFAKGRIPADREQL